MTFRAVADFEALTGEDALTPAEVELIEACRAGTDCRLEDGERPDTDTPARRIRASLLRLLIVGGSDSCGLADRAVDLRGGWIDEQLNLDFATGRGFTNLMYCHFTDQPQMNSSRLGGLNLTGSKLPGLFAQGAKVTQSVFLRDGFHATGTVTLNGVEIGGQLDSTKGRFDGNGEEALTAHGVNVTQSVHLHDGFHATGTVELNGAEIGGQLACVKGRFDGNGGKAMNGQNATIGDALFWRTVRIDAGMVDFNSAKIGVLFDDLASWPGDPEMLSLDGFTYDRIASFTDTKQRLVWLERGAHWPGLFIPQPYVQLARILRAQGHVREACKVAYEAEKLSRRHENKLLRIKPNGDVLVGLHSIERDLRRAWLGVWSWVLRMTVGYGLYPIRSIAALTLLIGVAWGISQLAWIEGSIVPNSGPVLVSDGWLNVADAPNAAEIWSKSDPGRDWETFNSAAWAADLVIPIVDLGQTAAWASSTERGPWGERLWWARWLLITFGWIVSALGAAAITGIIRGE